LQSFFGFHRMEAKFFKELVIRYERIAQKLKAMFYHGGDEHKWSTDINAPSVVLRRKEVNLILKWYTRNPGRYSFAFLLQ
jgi:hypothetical protein